MEKDLQDKIYDIVEDREEFSYRKTEKILALIVGYKSPEEEAKLVARLLKRGWIPPEEGKVEEPPVLPTYELLHMALAVFGSKDGVRPIFPRNGELIQTLVEKAIKGQRDADVKWFEQQGYVKLDKDQSLPYRRQGHYEETAAGKIFVPNIPIEMVVDLSDLHGAGFRKVELKDG